MNFPEGIVPIEEPLQRLLQRFFDLTGSKPTSVYLSTVKQQVIQLAPVVYLVEWKWSIAVVCATIWFFHKLTITENCNSIMPGEKSFKPRIA